MIATLRRGHPCPPDMLGPVARWLAAYEVDVEREVGVGHRTPRPGVASQLAPPQPCSLADAWRELGTVTVGKE